MYPELKKVLQHIVNKIAEHKLDHNYSLLSQAYQKVLTASTPENDTEIQRLETLINTAQKDVEPVGYTHKEMEIFNSFDTEKVLGLSALENQKKQAEGIRNNPHAVSEVYAKMGNEITALQKRANQIIESLADVWGEEKSLPPSKSLVTLTFDHEVGIENMRNLQEQSNDWVKIIAMCQKVLRDPTTDPAITTMSKGSPLDISLLGDPILLTFIAYNFTQVAGIVKQILEIIKLTKQLEAAELDRKSKEIILKQMEESQEKMLEEKIDKVATAIAAKLTKYMKNDAESKSTHRMAIRHIYNFANNGGIINIHNHNSTTKSVGLPDGDLDGLESVKQVAYLRKELNNPTLPNALIDAKKDDEMLQKIREEQAAVEKVVKKKRKYTKRKKTNPVYPTDTKAEASTTEKPAATRTPSPATSTSAAETPKSETPNSDASKPE